MFREFFDDLSSKMAATGSGIYGVAELLTSQIDRGFILEFLKDYLVNWELYPHDSSYRHNNGFQKVSLLKTDELHVRLHVWHDTSPSKIHDHDWDFFSFGLFGQIDFRNFRDCLSGSVYQKYKLAESRQDGSGTLKSKSAVREERVCLEPTSDYSLIPNCWHSIKFDIPHQSTVRRSGSVSLIITDRSKRNHSFVYLSDGQAISDNVYKFYRNKEKLDTIRSILERDVAE